MNEQHVTHIVLQQYRSSSFYSERETAAASHLGIGTIRHLRAVGLIEGGETGGGLGFSEEEVTQLRQIRPLQPHPGGNPAGGGVMVPPLQRLGSAHHRDERERERE